MGMAKTAAIIVASALMIACQGKGILKETNQSPITPITQKSQYEIARDKQLSSEKQVDSNMLMADWHDEKIDLSLEQNGIFECFNMDRSQDERKPGDFYFKGKWNYVNSRIELVPDIGSTLPDWAEAISIGGKLEITIQMTKGPETWDIRITLDNHSLVFGKI